MYLLKLMKVSYFVHLLIQEMVKKISSWTATQDVSLFPVLSTTNETRTSITSEYEL